MAGKKKKDKNKRRRASARDRADANAGGGSNSIKLPDGLSFFKIEKTNYRLDFLPYVVGNGNPYAEPGDHYYERTYFVHKSLGVNNDTYVCPAKTADLPCPVCNYIQQGVRKGVDKDILDAIKVKERQIFLVIDAKDKQREIQVLDFSNWLFGKKLNARIRSDEDGKRGYEWFWTDDEGSTVTTSWDKKNYQGRGYSEIESIDFDRRDDLPEDEVEHGYVLDDFIVIPEYDELEAVLMGESKKKGKKKDKKEKKDKDEEPEKKKEKKSRKERRSESSKPEPEKKKKKGKKKDKPPADEIPF